MTDQEPRFCIATTVSIGMDVKRLRQSALRHNAQRMAILTGALTFSTISVSSDVLNASKTVCINENTQEQRTIELVYQSSESPIPCSLYYDKAGERSEVASARNSSGHCEKVERKMVRNLVKSGWDCQHSFLGSLGDLDRKDITLNLFAADALLDEADTVTESTTDSTSPDSSERLQGGAIHRGESSTDPTALQIASDLKATLEEEYISELQQQLEDDFAAALGTDYIVGVTVQLSLEVNISPVSGVSHEESDLTAEAPVDIQIGSPSSSESAATLAPDSGNRNTHSPGGFTHVVPGNFTLASQTFDNEGDAHRFASEFHGLYPGVQSRVARFDNGDTWRLVLGTTHDRATLDGGVALLDTDTQRYFQIFETGTASSTDGSLEWVPDDWARYAVAGCYAKGNTTSIELANCAGVVLDVDSFLSCLAGGICVPERFSKELSPQQIDFLEVVGSDDPVAAARGILINNIQGCEQLTDPGSQEAAECVALSILDDDQRQMYDCYERADEQLDLVDCIGNETLSDNLMLFERCSIDSLAMTECVMAEVNNDYLNSAARCVNYGDTEAILTCAVDANIDTDQSRVLACVTDYSDRSDQAQCLTHEYLDDEQAALLSCAKGDERTESNFSLCVANQRGILSGDEYRAAECLLSGETEPNSLLSCAGARFASNELNYCLDANVPLSDCFSTETVISEVVASRVDDLLDVQAIDNQIAMFRADLYALEGGDLSRILSSEASSELFAATDEVVKEVQKKGTGLFKKFGFGK